LTDLFVARGTIRRKIKAGKQKNSNPEYIASMMTTQQGVVSFVEIFSAKFCDQIFSRL
jgi:hypothetical protein